MDRKTNPSSLAIFGAGMKALGVGILAALKTASWDIPKGALVFLKATFVYLANKTSPTLYFFLAMPTRARQKNAHESISGKTLLGIFMSCLLMGPATFMVSTCPVFHLDLKEALEILLKTIASTFTVSTITNVTSGIYEAGRRRLLVDKGETPAPLLESESLNEKDESSFPSESELGAMELHVKSCLTKKTAEPAIGELVCDPSQGTCQVCGETFAEDRPFIYCEKCGTPHHKDCWGKDGKCSIYACGCANRIHAPLAKS